MFLDKYIPGSNLAIFTAIVSAMVSLIAYSFQKKLTSLINPLFTNKNAIFKSLYVVGSIGLIICIILFSTTIVQASLVIYSIFYKLGWASFHNFSIYILLLIIILFIVEIFTFIKIIFYLFKNRKNIANYNYNAFPMIEIPIINNNKTKIFLVKELKNGDYLAVHNMKEYSTRKFIYIEKKLLKSGLIISYTNLA